MASTNYTENKFDEYLDQIRNREKVSNRRRIMKIGLILAILVTGLILFQQYTQNPAQARWHAVAYDELNQEKLSELLADHRKGIVVTHHLLGEDTIRGLADYHRFRDLVDLIEITEEDVDKKEEPKEKETEEYEFASLSQPEESAKLEPGRLQMTEDATLKPFAIRINGATYARENIKFTVVNYDPSVRYMIDFGNGVTRRIRRSTIYAYPLKGVHLIRLIASSKDKGSSVYTKKLTILPPLDQGMAVRKQGSTNQSINPLTDELNINEINRVTAFTVPRSSSGEKQEKEVESKNDIDLVDLGQLKNKEGEVEKKKPEATVDKPLVYAEKMPSFPGGAKALKSYLKKHLDYPSEALEYKTQGQVIVQFVIEADGTITNPKVLKGIGSGCDEEALRIVGEMPKWIPGESNGLRVPVYQSIPINFRLFE